MWSIVATISLFASTSSASTPKKISIFNDDHIIFRSSFNITKLLVPSHGVKYVQTEYSDLPSVFFTISDSRFEGGSSVYVLEDLTAYEILEGGRDSTSDYGSDVDVYIGAKDGIYKYDRDSISVKKIGPFNDSIIQIQKANEMDTFYILTDENKMFKLEKNATVKTGLKHVVCATQFVLDTSNNIYYVQCGNRTINVIKANISFPGITAVSDAIFVDIILLRPAFIMDDSIPFFGDGRLYILYANGTFDRKDLFIKERPSAFSVDVALYLVAALDGNIYEHNVMDMMLKSMFGKRNHGLDSINKLITSKVGSTKDYVFEFYNGWMASELTTTMQTGLDGLDVE